MKALIFLYPNEVRESSSYYYSTQMYKRRGTPKLKYFVNKVEIVISNTHSKGDEVCEL
jgi:hypothetical protein